MSRPVEQPQKAQPPRLVGSAARATRRNAPYPIPLFVIAAQAVVVTLAVAGPTLMPREDVAGRAAAEIGAREAQSAAPAAPSSGAQDRETRGSSFGAGPMAEEPPTDEPAPPAAIPDLQELASEDEGVTETLISAPLDAGESSAAGSTYGEAPADPAPAPRPAAPRVSQPVPPPARPAPATPPAAPAPAQPAPPAPSPPRPPAPQPEPPETPVRMPAEQPPPAEAPAEPEPPLPAAQTRSGHGHGDPNHVHTGPPGQEKRKKG